MSEYSLKSRLKSIREDEQKKIILKPFDKYDLLGYVEIPKPTIDDIFEDDDLGLLDTDNDLSIYKFKHTPKLEERAETDFVAQRKPIKEKDFKPYEAMFHKVHRELKEGKRKMLKINSPKHNLIKGNFYLIDGVLAYLEDFKEGRENKNLKKSTSKRKDGRTKTIFENGTVSNMYYRSLSKALYNNGKLITNTEESIENELLEKANAVNEDDLEAGWIYVLKSKSKNPQISDIKNLYKIGYSKTPVNQRISNANKEATYLFADVEVISSYKCYNLIPHVFENLIHRFFSEVCLNVDIETPEGQRITPREWFIAPFSVIDEVINLIINGNIVNYVYDGENKSIKLK